MHNRKLIIFALVIVVASSNLFATEIVILQPSDVPALMKQCSRSVPGTSTEGWLPNLEIVNEIKTQLMESSILKTNKLQNIEKYNFQIAGITLNGKKVIYLNGVGISAWSNSKPSEPIIACDGGNLFFGVVYNPDNKSFERLSINGPNW